jgi:hypothetical protein
MGNFKNENLFKVELIKGCLFIEFPQFLNIIKHKNWH